MAEGWSSTQKTLCRYFMHGVCKGTNCHFSHDRSLRPSMVCTFYLRGECTYGDSCRYDHIRQDRLDSIRQPPVVKKSNLQNSQSSKSPLSVNAAEFKSTTNTNLRLTPLLKSSKIAKSKLCVDAPEFIPQSSQKIERVCSDISFAQVVGDSGCSPDSNDTECLSNISTTDQAIRKAFSELCPFYMVSGRCQRTTCTYIHGNLCEMCQLACLHPTDENQRISHMKECTKLIEAEMEHSFAIARSKEKICGVCMDIVMEKPQVGQRRFGILPNCSHCFCIECLRKWRQSKQFENKIVRSCPECRVQSDFVIPSRYWVDDKEKEEKDKLLNSYRKALSDRACKYFKSGEGVCPFGNKCFYLHAMPDGTKKDVGPPKRRKRLDSEGDLHYFLENMLLFDFIDQREQRLELIRGSIQNLLLEFQIDEMLDLSEDLLLEYNSSDVSDL